MGCVGSKGDVDKHPNVFRVVQGQEGQGGQAAGQELTSGQLEVTSTNLTLYRKRKPPTQWPLQCLRRYGYENDTFIFEAGRRCKTGEGIYSFRCRRADVLFNLLQDYIQESTYNNNNMTVNSLDEVQQSHERMDQDVAELRRALINQQQQQQQQQTTSGSNYIILHGNSNTTAANSGSGGPTQIPCSTTSPGRLATMNAQCHSSPQNAGAAANNYLDPLEATSTSATTPTTIVANQSSNNNNIYTNSMMIPGAGNVYQQLALAQSSPVAGAVMKPATVENSPAGTPGSASGRPLLANSDSLMRLRQSMSTEEVIAGRQSLATSPVPGDDGQQPLNTYMNVTPGEMMLLGQSSTGASTPGANTGSLSWRYSRMNSNASTTTTITERCYENMDAAVLSEVLNGPPLLLNSTSSNAISSGTIVMGNGGASGGGRVFGGRHSRPDIFSKVDLPMIDGAGFRMSEPCTPTSAGGVALNAAQQRKVNYIVLDLDGTTTTATTVNGSSGGSTANGQQQVASNSLTTPESPKKRQTLGYATIDFNKTVALSNSTNPTCESEASRKTRF